ncbi:FprA family A-type flavoprotein [Vallitalea pronyensis]|uniref:FprA family A-type flavoprotein n=1 Tax=Vallitalea pronyensis TaxID=1348613 RepID=A0A8J8MH80_9FIRM|nr:FprA family A-type flavoprotein [Vallitalea pronyensis]QUI21534.1 FprA family A-type flavoprotein [Vallitalea pronyensis]
MTKAKEVKKGIYWVGALDYDIRVFDVVMYTDYGTTYNAYFVKGSEKNVLFETVKDRFFDEFLERLHEVGSVDDIDYLVVNHTEPDHVGSVARLLELNPDITVVGTGTAIKFLKDIINGPFKSMVAKAGCSLDLGDKRVQFIMAPFLHWPDTMYSYIKEDAALITCDSFGCHYCDDKVFNDRIEGDFIDSYKYYFDMIMGPFKPYVLEALDKIKGLNFDTICPGHGPVLREDIDRYIGLYKTWATEVKREKPSVVIAYVSAYGYTKKIAERIAEGVGVHEGIDVILFDLVESDKADVMKEISLAKGLLLGSPTIVSDVLPPIWDILTSLNAVIHKGKIAGAFGSYGWSGEAVGNIEGRLKQLRLKMPVEGLKIRFNPSEEDFQDAFAYGEKFGKAILC